MPSAVHILQSSQGDENKVWFDLQNTETASLADDLDTTIERTIDLGIHIDATVITLRLIEVLSHHGTRNSLNTPRSRVFD